MSKIKEILFFVLCLPLLFAYQAYPAKNVVTGTSRSKSVTKPVVAALEIASIPLAKQLSYPARIVPEVSVAVLSEIDGVVPRVFVNLGQSVKEGQPIASVQHNEPGYQYKALHVTAPISGVISSVDVNSGAPVTKGQKLATITDPKKVYVEIEIAASDLLFISEGQVAKLFLPTFLPKQKIDLKVTGVSPLIDSATGTSSCQLRPIKSTDLVYLKPGLVGQVFFYVNQHKGIQIPENAIVYRESDTFVNTIQDGKIKSVKVLLGESDKGNTEILSGLKEKDLIVVRSSTFLTDGIDVTIEKGTDQK